MNGKRLRWDVLLAAAAFFLLAGLFVAECDDCYFVYWSFDSLWDFLRVRPIPEEGIVLGVPNNGRYLGNLLGLILGKLAFSPAWPLRVLILGSGLLGLTWLLARFFRSERVESREAFALALFLVVCAHRGIWQQVYSWSAAWANYLVPVLVLLAVLLLLERDRARDCPWLFLLALAGGLFTEQNTIWLVLLGSGLWAAGFVKGLRGALPCAGLRRALLLGGWAGLAVSMTNSVFAQVDSGLRGIGLELVQKNLPVVFTEVMLRPVPVCLLISALLVWLLARQGGRLWMAFAAVLVPLHGCIILQGVTGEAQYPPENLLLGAGLALLWVAMACCWKGGEAKGRLWFYVASLLVVTGPMVLVSPVHPRMFFSSYAFLCLIAALLYRQARDGGLRALTWLRWAAAAALAAVTVIYAQNHKVYYDRLELARQQVEQGAQEVTLPLLPHVDWASNEYIGKGDICYLVYREKPWDVAFQFVYYSKWQEMQ